MAGKIGETGHRRMKPACLNQDMRRSFVLDFRSRRAGIPPMPGSSNDFRRTEGQTPFPSRQDARIAKARALGRRVDG